MNTEGNDFWISHAPYLDRVMVHRGDCHHCNQGNGQPHQAKGKDTGDDRATHWHGPFSFDGAMQKRKSLRPKTGGQCRVCLRNDSAVILSLTSRLRVPAAPTTYPVYRRSRIA